MNAKELVRLPDPRDNVHIEMREVVRDVFEKPHLFIRVRLTGWHFPHRALEPFAVIGNVVSRMLLIDRDGLVADAYFDKSLRAAKKISFGYGNTIHWDFKIPVQPKAITRLDRSQLPEGTTDPFRKQVDIHRPTSRTTGHAK